MAAEDILDNWFDGPKDKNKLVNPRELLKGVGPVSYQGRLDYKIGVELGEARGTKFELKYPSWGFFPLREREELLSMIRISTIKQLILIYEQRNVKADIAAALNIPKAQKEQAKKLSQGMVDYFRGPLT